MIHLPYNVTMENKGSKKEIERLVQVIKDKYQPEKIILFGSAAHSDMNASSDIDLLIIKPSQKKRYYRAQDVFTILKDTKRTLPLDAIVLTPEEFEQGRQAKRYFIRQIVKEGKVLYEAS